MTSWTRSTSSTAILCWICSGRQASQWFNETWCKTASTFDVVTCFDSLEHWHHSPKRVLHDMWDSLKPGGLFIVSVPNNVNLRKRITVPFGYGRWSKIETWYDVPVFRGHVREPNTED